MSSLSSANLELPKNWFLMLSWFFCVVDSCQTYEGGFGAAAGDEAHGGYTFCGLATLTLLGREALLHTPSLLRWLANKQMRFEGGFQVRRGGRGGAEGSSQCKGGYPFPEAQTTDPRTNIRIHCG